MAGPIILSAAEMSRADRLAAAAGVASDSLMERAGEGVAQVAMRAWDKRPVAVLCGPGNNGGDGFVVARILVEAGWPVRVGLLGDRTKLKGDARAMADRFAGDIEAASPGILDGAGLIVDALFGTGLARPLAGAALEIVEAVNAHSAPVLAVDLPSGVNADSGAIMGAAVEAARTTTFFLKKPAHLLYPGRALCGAVDVVDIGIPLSTLDDIGPSIFENMPALWIGELPRPDYSAHKYSRGAAAIISGGRLKTGAARLAARGALRAGAGLVTVLTPPDAAAENAAQLTAVMVREAADARAIASVLADRRFTAAVVGPGAGVGEETCEKTLAILASGVATVLDADALSSFESEPERLFGALGPAHVLTPHAGEFKRIFKALEIEASGKLEAARRAAKQAGAVVLLKGADTVIAAPDGRAAINANAPPELATAGAGDVLAGFIAGLLAQGAPAFEAAAAAAWLHGACAAAVGPGLIAEDLSETLPVVLRRLWAPAAGQTDAAGE